MDLHYIFPSKPSEFKISISVESYDEKTTENDKIKFRFFNCATIAHVM